MWNQFVKQLQKTSTPQEEFNKQLTILIEHTLGKYFYKEQDINKLKQAIQKLASFAIQSDQSDNPLLFESFMEQDILLRYYDLMQLAYQSPQIVQEIFEAVSSLLLNIKQIGNKNYILSHCCISNMIMWKQPFEKNKPILEIIEIYISFLNLLAVKVDEITSMFFINIKYPQFPLLLNAIRFYNHQELMVRNKSRSIVLNLIKIQNKNIKIFTSSFPFIVYYYYLGEQLIDTFNILNENIKMISWNNDQSKWEQLNNHQEEIVEQFQYIHDIIENDSDLLEIVFKYSIQRPIEFISQVIKFGYPNLLINVAFQLLSLLLITFKMNKKMIQNIIITFIQCDDKIKINPQQNTWNYLNFFDLDPQFIQKISRQIYDNNQIIQIDEIRHENFEIRYMLQKLRMIPPLHLDQLNYEYFLEILQNQEYQKNDVSYYLLSIIQVINNQLSINIICNYLIEEYQQQSNSLITKLLILDLLNQYEYDVQEQYQQLKLEMKFILNEITFQQYQEVFGKQRTLFREEFVLNEMIKANNIYFIKLINLNPQQKLYAYHIIEQHIIFKGQRILKSLDQYHQQDIKIDQQAIMHNSLLCYYSDTGHFYNMELCKVLENDKYLIIVQADDHGIVKDIIFSNLWYYLEFELIELSQTLKCTYGQVNKFYLNFISAGDAQQLQQKCQFYQQQTLGWLID